MLSIKTTSTCGIWPVSLSRSSAFIEVKARSMEVEIEWLANTYAIMFDREFFLS